MRTNTPLFGFLYKELRQTLRDPKMRVALFVAPIFQLTLFGIALTNETRNVRLAVAYAPDDRLAEEIYLRSIASGWFVPASVTGVDPYGWIENREADAVLVAPSTSLARGLQRGNASLQLLINSQNAVRAQSIEAYLKSILHEMTVSHQATLAPSVAGSAPISFDVRPMYNPTFETSVYMVPGVMSMLVCIVTIILTGMSLAREKEVGTLETLISAPIRPIDVVLGKTVPFVLMGMVQMPLVLTAAVVLFDVPVRGPLAFLGIAAFFFVITTVSIGLLISTLAKSQQQAMLGGFLFLFPATLLSGLMFPLENMPLFMWWIAQINPLTHFVGLLRNILLKGGSLDYFVIHTGILAALSVAALAFAIRRFRTTL